MDLSRFKELVETRGPITWVGSVKNGIGARLSAEKKITVMSMREGLGVKRGATVVYNNESDKDDTNTGEVSPRQYSDIRLASVLGLNICRTCTP